MSFQGYGFEPSPKSSFLAKRFSLSMSRSSKYISELMDLLLIDFLLLILVERVCSWQPIQELRDFLLDSALLSDFSINCLTSSLDEKEASAETLLIDSLRRLNCADLSFRMDWIKGLSRKVCIRCLKNWAFLDPSAS